MIQVNDLALVLDQLEIRESELLCWGDTSGFFTRTEFEEILVKTLPDEDPDDVEEDLLARAIVVEVRNTAGKLLGFRSRVAEALHLYRNLRQWYIGQKLEETRTLVSDYRFLRYPRSYPNRNMKLDDVLPSWRGKYARDSVTERAIKQLVGPFELSGFQARATEHILEAWNMHRSGSNKPTATIICAGTGSGKTMAFYLPALSSLTSDVLGSPDRRTRILAIYPRNELLKDQFNETWEQCRRLDQITSKKGTRKIRIGALFGETPSEARYALEDNQDYMEFPLLKCKTDECRGTMRWERSDVSISKERLVCNLCDHEVSDDEVALTRQSMADNPPDILFTTTEMLNQRMGDSRLRHLFGIRTPHKIPLVLLDEVHTYDGSQGAQTSFLLKRWMRLSKNRPHFVGLSATLRNADNFFATLTGTNPTHVRLIEPRLEEMVEEGSEYLLALRGDPVSQTALLSTTIQAIMLTRRILDNRQNPRSEGVWGTKTFVFADDLDTINRLFPQFADAEGWEVVQGRGRDDYRLLPNQKGPLAQLRNPTTSKVQRSKLQYFGQDWSVAKANGFSLDPSDRTRPARTSSQDVGYDRDAEVIVTTASLEVGFNDPDVGAVIQHKAPRGVSSYLQRKGRAGRLRTIRPWMLVVLSDFGRDRAAYQQYENLVDPEIKIQSLPVDNSHIQKIQAAQAVLDWMSQRFKPIHIWYWLNSPKKNQTGNQKLLRLVDELLSFGPLQQELCDYVGTSLDLDDEALNRVLWHPPRSIFMEFLPTLRRKISSNWGVWSSREGCTVEWVEAREKWGSPVPGFIPDSSFDKFSTPTLQICLQRRGKSDWKTMPYFQGLREFAPGRISKRFATESGAISDWLVPQDYSPTVGDSSIDFEVAEAFGLSTTLIATVPSSGGGNSTNVHQPQTIIPTFKTRDRNVSDSSNAFLRWSTVFLPSEDGDINEIPPNSGWAEVLEDVAFYTHRQVNPLELIRYSTGSDAKIRLPGVSDPQEVSFNWVSDSRPVAIGARLFVDAVRLRFRVGEEVLWRWLQEEEIQRAVRLSFLQDSLKAHPVFGGNPFIANWVFECFLAVVISESSRSGINLKETIDAVCTGNSELKLNDIPEMLFQLGKHYQENSDDTEHSDIGRDQALQVELRQILQSAEIVQVLRDLSKCLYIPVPEIGGILRWSRRVLGNTYAAATLQALRSLLPNVDDESINADVEVADLDANELTIWISEEEGGGIGIVSQLQDIHKDDPSKFLNILHRCLQSGDYEQLDQDLCSILKVAVVDGPIKACFSAVREATNYRDRLAANREMKFVLSAEGYLFSHSFSAVLHSRILRPGSGIKSDRQLMEYLDRWYMLEGACGLEIPMHILAFVVATEEEGIAHPIKVFEKACNIASTLWVKGSSARQISLDYFNRFQGNNLRTERLLGVRGCVDRTPETRYTNIGWLEAVHQHLDREGSVDLVVDREDSNSIPNILATIHVEPLDTHGLFFFPRLKSVSRVADHIRLRLELAESVHK